MVNESKRYDSRYWQNLPSSAIGTMESAMARHPVVNLYRCAHSQKKANGEGEDGLETIFSHEDDSTKRKLFPITPPSIDNLLLVIRQKAKSPEDATNKINECMKCASKESEKAGTPGTIGYAKAWTPNYRNALTQVATELVIGSSLEIEEGVYDSGNLPQ